MLPKPKRLSTKAFKEIIDTGKYLHNPLFLFRSVSFQGPSKFSVSVPKKVAKTAVLRNKIRRRIYSVLNKLFPEFKDGIQAILIAKPDILKASFKELSTEIKEFFGKTGLLK